MSTNLIDSHKLIFHPQRVAQWADYGDCFPIYVEIGLTNRCNHRCIFCALDWLDNPKEDINSTVLLRALDDMAEHGVKSIMFAGEGESLLHKDVALFAQRAYELGIKVAVTTNGVALSKDRAEACLPFLSWIRFSVNASSPKQYAVVHRTNQRDFDRVINNITYAVQLKNTRNLSVDIGVQSLIIPESIEGALDLAKKVKDAGVDNFQVKPYSQHPSSSNTFSVNLDEYNELETELKKIETDSFHIYFRQKTIQRLVDGIDYDCCHGLPFFALINARGQIIPCNLFYNNPDFVYGDLNQLSFSEIWQSEQRKSVLSALKKQGVVQCRQACRLDPINRYLHRVKNPHPRDEFV